MTRPLALSQELKVKIVGIIGAASPFWQGGSIRIILPKRVGWVYGLKRSDLRELENFTFIFLETDKGILMCPLENLVKDETLAGTVRSS